MIILDEIKNVSKKLPGQIFYEHSMKNLNWFNLGGAAKVFFKPKTLEELIFFFKKIFQNSSNYNPWRRF